MEYTGCVKKRRTSSFSHFDEVRSTAKKSGPSRFCRALAEKIFLRRVYTGQRIIENCSIPNTRATFLIVFSPDGTKFASTNGNHNIYVISVTTKKILKTLSGHKRTPWTLAFHPTNNNILASGCLDGEVRIWNLEDSTCEVWQSPGQTVIASLTFHPKVKLLVIATYQDLYFWDWSTSTVVCHTSTENEQEKIRYVKFDSSGDKLITAIALRNRILSQSDAITFREIYQYNRERELFIDFQRIQRFLNTQIINRKTCETNVDLVADVSKPSIETDDRISPNLCTAHYHSFQNFLNVDSFCPTEFSIKVVKMLKENTIPVANFSGRCYLCRYTWLYEAVFKFRLLYDKENHICGDHRTSADEHAWNFTESRKQELIAENKDEINGLTENMLRYSFERFARTSIAPYFAQCIPGSVSSQCFAVNSPPLYFSGIGCASDKRPYSHNVALRSDCFLNLCQVYNFDPKGSFATFQISFAEVYQFLSSLQQISTKEDDQKLNAIMTEWEYLYCKMLLVCAVIEGDKEFLSKERPCSPQTRTNSENNEPCSTSHASPTKSQSWTPERCQTVMNSLKSPSRDYNIQHFIRQNDKTKNTSGSSDTKTECQSCKRFNGCNAFTTSASMKALQRELDAMSTAIKYRYNAKIQRDRIGKLYTSQCNDNISRMSAAIIRTIETFKKCILAYLATSIRELKVLLKSSFINTLFTDEQPLGNFTLMFIFITKKMVSLSNAVLDFMCNFNYNVLELTKKTNIDYLKANFLFAGLFNRHRARFTFNRENDPVFDEELYTTTSDLSDDELSSNTPADLKLKTDEFGSRSTNETILDSSEIDPRAKQISEIGIVASKIYLTKHLKLLDAVSRRWQIRDYRLDTYDLLLLQNVNALLDYFYHQVAEIGVNSRHSYTYHPLHRLQMWDFSALEIPNISSKVENIVVTECKVHNDATIAISHDDTRIATLLSPNQFCQPDWLGVFSLEWKTLGHILWAVPLNQIAVSLSFSSTNEYLAVAYSYTYKEDIKMADVLAVKRETCMWKDLTLRQRSSPVVTSVIDAPNVDRCNVSTTVNCIKWIPEAGQGLILGNSAGEIKCVY